MGRNAAGLVEFQRLRVDNGEAGFWMGRQFGISYEFSVTSRQVIKVAAVENVLLYVASVQVDTGGLRYRVFSTLTDAVETATFGESLSEQIVPLNVMTVTPEYTVTTQVATGGDIDETGLVAFPTARIRTADNSNFRQTAGALPGSQRGFRPGFAYVVLETLGENPATGVIDYRFEERDWGY